MPGHNKTKRMTAEANQPSAPKEKHRKLRSRFSVFGAYIKSKRHLVLWETPFALPNGQQGAGSRQHDSGKKRVGLQAERAAAAH